MPTLFTSFSRLTIPCFSCPVFWHWFWTVNSSTFVCSPVCSLRCPHTVNSPDSATLPFPKSPATLAMSPVPAYPTVCSCSASNAVTYLSPSPYPATHLCNPPAKPGSGPASTPWCSLSSTLPVSLCLPLLVIFRRSCLPDSPEHSQYHSYICQGFKFNSALFHDVEFATLFLSLMASELAIRTDTTTVTVLEQVSVQVGQCCPCHASCSPMG
uniref:uncharacterized protein LOC109972199 n=1 Tax=Monopterus albus TaxID=43700 RepID=UPI0009B434E2|nr:uncharacterized protein LOC109972199 [Monopterus albus]